LTDPRHHPAITVIGPATGSFTIGDHNMMVNSGNIEQHTAADLAAALDAFTRVMDTALADLGPVGLTADQQALARQALAELRGQAEPERAHAALRRFVSYLSQAGQPVLTAAFMTLALHLGAVPPG
jgi:hypothetical protein